MRITRSLLVAVAVAAPSAILAEEAASPHAVSANIAITTDYRFRGISQTLEDPAIQGGFDYTYNPVGFYAGVWASNIEFLDSGAVVDEPTIEVDYYGGFRGTFSNGITWDVGGIWYSYPAQDEDDLFGVDYDYGEIKGALGYTFADAPLAPVVGGSVWYSPDFFGSEGDAVYVGGSLDLSLPAGFVLGFDVGYQDIEGDALSGAVGGSEYVHYRIGVSKTIVGITLDVSYQDVSDDKEFVCGGGALDICDGTVMFTASTVFNLL